ncbi:hypothetical protein DAEQUDRAFT_731158 [Daedalea quercina L-15889]|uniref:Uncharacterized protein n=1 Tax=Daedalea quercina L-15889 TaxID=1314783 RepID=A0A165MII0_9APHY|nr:hypothetical protein DAEQUDRAFT_731158 [Daedalea quercina L-15889]
MSEDGVVSSIVSLGCIACFDVLAGILTDLASVRHTCTEHCCRCSCGRSPDSGADHHTNDPHRPLSSQGEHEPLLAGPKHHTDLEPRQQPSMQVPASD